MKSNWRVFLAIPLMVMVIGLLAIIIVKVKDPNFGSKTVNIPSFGKPDAVHIVVTEFPVDEPPATAQMVFDQTFGQSIAQQLYAQMLAGGQISSDASCPAAHRVILASPYDRYTLTFQQHGKLFATVIDNAIACWGIDTTFANGAHAIFWWNTPTVTFFAAMSNDAGVPLPLSCLPVPPEETTFTCIRQDPGAK